MAAFIVITCEHGDIYSTCAARVTLDTLDIDEARRRAARLGWTRLRDGERCPSHSPARPKARS